MKFSWLVALLGGAVVLSGCASGPTVDPQITSAVSSHNVSSSVAAKVDNGRPLDVADIQDLVQHKVSDQMIVSYLQSTQRIYNLNYSQLQQLRNAGASQQLLNYLSETQGFFGVAGSPHKSWIKGVQKDYLYRSPAYQDEQPFAYNQPWVDGFYDSGYEESLYSPFSMNP